MAEQCPAYGRERGAIAGPPFGRNRGEAIAVVREGSEGLAGLGRQAKLLASARCSLGRTRSLAGAAPCWLCSGSRRVQGPAVTHTRVPVRSGRQKP